MRRRRFLESLLEWKEKETRWNGTTNTALVLTVKSHFSSELDIYIWVMPEVNFIDEILEIKGYRSS